LGAGTSTNKRHTASFTKQVKEDFLSAPDLLLEIIYGLNSLTLDAAGNLSIIEKGAGITNSPAKIYDFA